ncbi:MAG: 4-hydroxy-tetrahydrodipicolinate reductase [Flavobacteriales bacterium]
MRVALLGYGKMGRAIEAVLKERGHEVALTVTQSNPLMNEALNGIDVAIEFSRPDQAASHIRTCLMAGCPIVVGTTGWYHEWEAIRSMCGERGGALFHATNFSIGVNMIFHINKQLAKMMAGFPAYSPSITEIHHTAKLDAPSGTAITLAEGIIENHPQTKSWSLEANPGGDILAIDAQRIGEVPGTHIIRYHSDVDDIEIHHAAHHRGGFAQGAVSAAEFLIGKQGIYSMQDLLGF